MAAMEVAYANVQTARSQDWSEENDYNKEAIVLKQGVEKTWIQATSW